ncbi:extensin [Iris pallida]|uniref:Extensin n=1 Tax=Iris pallida TaxID=29817 RepID=A0AAX6HH59_IRIPA|nr:extensin [Iris pallida]KAJ6839864.1 extensin [Iris pallida]
MLSELLRWPHENGTAERSDLRQRSRRCGGSRDLEDGAILGVGELADGSEVRRTSSTWWSTLGRRGNG